MPRRLAAVRRVAQALLDRKLSAERPLVILSGNSLEHALLALAAMHAGVLYAPLAPAYSLQAREYGTLRHILSHLEPGLVFAAEGASFERALDAVLPSGTEIVVSSSAPEGWRATSFAELAATPPTAAVDDAHARVGPETIAKILYTSGSTGRPKGVVNTQRMLCSNQEMLRTVLPFLAEEPPVLCDWLPWNHTAGGNHNFGLVLWNGGTLYIDEGRPLPGRLRGDVRQPGRDLRDRPLHSTADVRDAAPLPAGRPPSCASGSSPGSRSSSTPPPGSPSACSTSSRRWRWRLAARRSSGSRAWGPRRRHPSPSAPARAGASAGFLGFPVPGLEFKLAPVGEKLEGRVRGPNVTPGYWRDDGLTSAAFDAEGFYRLGDAMRFLDADDPARGLVFDGRLAENFKLSTGTWVGVGALRARLLAHGAGYVQDAVIAGARPRFRLGALVPEPAAVPRPLP